MAKPYHAYVHSRTARRLRSETYCLHRDIDQHHSGLTVLCSRAGGLKGALQSPSPHRVRIAHIPFLFRSHPFTFVRHPYGQLSACDDCQALKIDRINFQFVLVFYMGILHIFRTSVPEICLSHCPESNLSDKVRQYLVLVTTSLRQRWIVLRKVFMGVAIVHCLIGIALSERL